MEWLPDRRDDLRERRRRLRLLDVLLLAEIDFFGSAPLPELTDAVADGPETKDLQLSAETIREWWDDALRRRLLDEVIAGDLTRYAVSEGGTLRLDAARANDALDHRPMLRALGRLITIVLPSAAALTAFVTLGSEADRDPCLRHRHRRGDRCLAPWCGRAYLGRETAMEKVPPVGHPQ